MTCLTSMSTKCCLFHTCIFRAFCSTEVANIHAYNLFIPSIFFTYSILIRFIKCTCVKHSLPRAIKAWKSIAKKNTISSCSSSSCSALKRKFWYKRQLARPRCHSFVNQQRTRQELVINLPRHG